MVDWGRGIWYHSLKLRVKSYIACILAVGALQCAPAASLPFASLADVAGPYEGTGARGDAFYMCKLGDAGTLPVCAFWSSARLERSPFFGLGWCVPILESRFVSIGNDRWAFYQPDGFRRVFVKPERGDGSILSGGRAWTAVVDGDNARVIADVEDGVARSEFHFVNGRMIRMVCEEGDYEIRYYKGVAERIVSKGKTLLEVSRDGDVARRFDFSFNGGREHAWAVCRESRVFGERGDSYAVLSIQEYCLTQLALPDGSKHEFGYSGEGVEAFFSVDDSRWVWDPSTRRVISHGKWRFSISEPKEEWNEPSFIRKDVSGGEDFFLNDRKTGIRTERFADGGMRSCRVFTSGPLEGRRLRWIERKNADGVPIRAYYVYDGEGRLFYRRATRGKDGELVETWYNHDGLMTRRRVKGEYYSVGENGSKPAPIPNPSRSDARMSRDSTPPPMYSSGSKEVDE